MSASLQDHIEQSLGQRPARWRACAGGDSARAFRGELEDGTRIFVKAAHTGAPFAMEALGLHRMRDANALRVPRVLHADSECLVLEWIDFASPANDFQSRLGTGLARLHNTVSDAYGFDGDHAIGMSPQKNLPRVSAGPDAWADFWWTHRLEPMIRRLPSEEARRFRALEPRLPDLVSDTGETPSLLHGDLWSGNVAADAEGNPVLFDPAPYYGHPEADLGMTRMFGGFTEDFYRAYVDTRPLVEGWRDRLGLYMLYHVLNHWILFGTGYRARALDLLHDYL